MNDIDKKLKEAEVDLWLAHKIAKDGNVRVTTDTLALLSAIENELTALKAEVEGVPA